MRITEIQINNFRQYEKLNLKFDQSSKHDLHIVIADNGVGKTNILNSITWCLYGDEPHLGNESKSLPRLNLSAKRKAEEIGNTSVSICVNITVEDEGDIIHYQRKVPVNLEPTYFELKDELTVTVMDISGNAKVYAGEEANGYVEKYMPKRIRQYFYFDGEQLDSYFISDESSKIKETIHAISQVDVVTRVKERLLKVITSKQHDAGKKAPNIQKINAEIDSQKKEIYKIEADIKELKEQIAISNKIIKENTEHLSGQENLPEIEEEYQKLLNKKTILEEKKKLQINELYLFVREKKIALSLYAVAKKTINIIDDKEKNNALPPNIDKKMLNKLKNGAMCTVCGQPLGDAAKEYIAQLIEQIQVSSETSNILMAIRSELERIISSALLYDKEKQKYLKSYKDCIDELKECEIRLQELDDTISKFSDKEKIIRWHSERKKHMDLLEINKPKLGVREFCLQEAIRKKEDAEGRLAREMAKEKECENLRKIIKFSSSVQEIVCGIETEMMHEVKAKMQDQTMDYFTRLIWKKGIYDHITLDDKYQLDLFHRDGYSCVGSCSAAERSLLALSFTLALHEVSGFNSLLFIDTPVARVSSQNRINFANVLEQVSNEKQLIMTFTPDEFSESISKVFLPVASTAIHLKMNDENEITNIEG
ncbi:AAA family ATPase [Clostridium sp. ZBS17]|uniref:AAA family ATPase n=1 Tax=Clostridium sp. ZBS17 TaxID=2949968 RepID=UPI00207A9155|nr:AAA family ATPase [Clostridium sp. ZBS17]